MFDNISSDYQDRTLKLSNILPSSIEGKPRVNSFIQVPTPTPTPTQTQTIIPTPTVTVFVAVTV